MTETERQLTDAILARYSKPDDLDLRDTEHNLFVQSVLQKAGPVLGSAIVGTSVPAYSAVKGAAQAFPYAVGKPIREVTGVDLTKATPASMREVAAGLGPLVGNNATYNPQLSQFKPENQQDVKTSIPNEASNNPWLNFVLNYFIKRSNSK